MIRKLFIIFVLFCLPIFVFATEYTQDEKYNIENYESARVYHSATERLNNYIQNEWVDGDVDDATYRDLKEQYNQAKLDAQFHWVEWVSWELTSKELEDLQKKAEDARDSACDRSGWCLEKSSFRMDVSNFAPGGETILNKWWGGEEVIKDTLQTLITKLMIAFGSIALLIMTIGAGYMIMYSGQDELLTKWKTIFMWWVIALFVALSAWILVKLLAYLLYNT